MTIIVEDGTGVPGANSYIDEAYLTEYAASRGETLPPELEPAIIRAMDKVESYRKNFSGKRRFKLAYPRTDAWVDGEEFPNDEIPDEIKRAQAMFAVLVATGTSLFANFTSAAIKREKVDVLETEYAVSADSSVVQDQPYFGEAELLLQSLYGCFDYGINMPVRRA